MSTDFLPGQAEMFEPPSSIEGLAVRVWRSCKCGHRIFVVGPAKGPHHALLTCKRCFRHAGWLSHEQGKAIAEIVKHFGRPTEVIDLRIQQTFPDENRAASGENVAHVQHLPMREQETER